MDELLRPISSARNTAEEPMLLEVKPDQVLRTTTSVIVLPTTPEDALEILRNEPDYDSLLSILRLFCRAEPGSPSFRIGKPGPLSAQIIQVLVNDITPNYWILLKEGTPNSVGNSTKHPRSDSGLFLSCLRNLSGVNALLARLRLLIGKTKEDQQQQQANRTDVSLELATLLEVLSAVLSEDDCLLKIWSSTAGPASDEKINRPLAQELASLMGGGRVLSLAAEAQSLVGTGRDAHDKTEFWMGNSLDYTRWLSRNILSMKQELSTGRLRPDLLGKALRLGHPDAVVKLLFDALTASSVKSREEVQALFRLLPQLDQRKVIFSVLSILSKEYLDRFGSCEDEKDKTMISAAAGVVDLLVGTNAETIEHLVIWLASSSGAGIGEGVGIRRAALAVIAKDKDILVNLFEKSLTQFGDQLYIKHSPVIQQEAHAQVLLLSAGYVGRKSQLTLNRLMRSSSWLNAISNRLASSQDKSRFLGMAVGEAVSSLVDNKDKKLDFHMDELNSAEGMWYKNLVRVSDEVGSIDTLRLDRATKNPRINQPTRPPKPIHQVVPRPPQSGFVIEEVEDSDDEDDDLVPYTKPDSDAEDSDEDATLVRRDKPKAPVYIRTLISYLRDTESYDHQKLALVTAPVLIRRKANYGTEVKDHAEELAGLLVGLQDKFEIDDFQDLRMQSMTALIVAQPPTMGQWFARTFFDGDFSIAQRASVLAVLGLAAREIAGLDTSEYATAAAFPSKTLPERMERLYIDGSSSKQAQLPSTLKALPPNALENVASSLTATMLAPIAATAADAVTGPDALKLSTFTSRLNQAGSGNPNVRVKSKAKPRTRAIPNTTAQLISSSFFAPLSARFQAALHSPASRSRGVIFQSHLLALFIKTLAILVHAAGPTTLALPQMTAELWGVLLNSSIRAQCVGNLGVTQAVVFAFLTLLDVNEDRMRDICQDMGREVVETQEWVAQVFEGIRGEDGGQENEVKMLSAAVLIRLREGIEKYQMLLMGDMIGYS